MTDNIWEKPLIDEKDAKEEKLLNIIKEVGFGEIKVIINEGKPIRIEELKKSIKL